MVTFVLGLILVAVPFGVLICLLSRAQASRYPRQHRAEGGSAGFWGWPIWWSSDAGGDNESSCDGGGDGGGDSAGGDGGGDSGI